jgi:hypothetical protein
MPIYMRCLNCDGSGCEKCEFQGTEKITDCPLTLVTNDIWEALFYSDLYEKGLPPVAGGVLNQVAVFTQAFYFIQQEKNYWKSKLGITNAG